MIIGSGGVEVPTFVATKNEILQRVRYRARVIIDLDFTFFVCGCTGSSEWRTREFASRRLNTMARVIGEEAVTKVLKDAEQTFGNGVGQRVWKIFMEGTQEEQERLQELQERLARDSKPAHRGGEA